MSTVGVDPERHRFATVGARAFGFHGAGRLHEGARGVTRAAVHAAGAPCYTPHMTTTTPRLPTIAWVYLLLSLLGAASTWTYNVLALRELGSAYTPAAFLRVGFEGSVLLGSLASDFWVGSLAALVWMVVEAGRLGMRRRWLYVVLTFVIAWAFAFPLFLFMRERRLAAMRSLAQRPNNIRNQKEQGYVDQQSFGAVGR
jgi:hypothetical protein